MTMFGLFQRIKTTERLNYFCRRRDVPKRMVRRPISKRVKSTSRQPKRHA